MAWKSIHWGRTRLRQKTRFERYADDSWMLLISPGRAYLAFRGAPSDRAWRRRYRGAHNQQIRTEEGS